MVDNESLGLLIEIEKPFIYLQTENGDIIEIDLSHEKDNEFLWETYSERIDEGLYLPFSPKTKRLLELEEG